MPSRSPERLEAELLNIALEDELTRKLYPLAPAPGSAADRAFQEPGDLERAWQQLRRSAPLVSVADIDALRQDLVALADNGGQILQMGDCAEAFADCHPEGYLNRFKFIDSVRRTMALGLKAPVVAIGRLAGQFAKPRSQFYEPADLEIQAEQVHSFMGEMINSPQRDVWSRTPQLARLLWAQQAARVGTEALSKWNREQLPIYCSHEALSLVYDGAQTLPGDRGGSVSPDLASYNRSCHLPWIGKRTAYIGSQHLAYLPYVGNPVAAKIGPGTMPHTLDALLDGGNPHNEPGKMILITRLGAGQAKHSLPPLIKRVKNRGAKVIWIIDPMHGNTHKNSHGVKYRAVADICTEITEVLAVHKELGSRNSGLHLETSPGTIGECCPTRGESDKVVEGPRYQSLCDPRLDYEQTVKVVHHYLSQLG